MIFHIKSTSPQIRENDLERLHNYIGKLVKTTGCAEIKAGGVGDQYIANQKEHHTKHSFAEEYKAFLKLYNVEYDENFVFRD